MEGTQCEERDRFFSDISDCSSEMEGLFEEDDVLNGASALIRPYRFEPYLDRPRNRETDSTDEFEENDDNDNDSQSSATGGIGSTPLDIGRLQNQEWWKSARAAESSSKYQRRGKRRSNLA